MERLELHCIIMHYLDDAYPSYFCKNLYAGIKLRFELMCCHAYYFLNYFLLWGLLVWVSMSSELFHDDKIRSYSFFIIFPLIFLSLYDQILLICGIFVEFPRRIL